MTEIPAQMIGQTVAHYKILEKIGSGGMGDVYLAEDTTLDRKVALKVLPKELTGDAERRARFTREAKALAALNHPSIIAGPRERHDIWKLSLDGGKVSRLTKLEGRRGNIGEALATDGRYLYSSGKRMTATSGSWMC